MIRIGDEKTLRDLEFARALELVAVGASTSLGEEAVRSLTPTTDLESIERAMAEVREAIAYLDEHGRFSLGAVRDLGALFQEGHERSILDGEQLLTVRLTLEASTAVRELLVSLEEQPRLAQLGSRLSDTASLVKRLHRAIDDRGEIRPDASPQLLELSQQLEALERRVTRKLQGILDRSPELISEPIVTRRQGRLVIPIRSGATGAMAFVVHDRSATGQTLYAEPAELVGDNNRITETATKVREERQRIRCDLTAAVCSYEAVLRRDQAILAHVDSLFARGAYAVGRQCSFPRMGARIALRNARHPLLPSDS
ncbi:MAG: hypothetical protein JSW65_07335, partial [Candidatus Bipolaricaulota bacterium]